MERSKAELDDNKGFNGAGIHTEYFQSGYFSLGRT